MEKRVLIAIPAYNEAKNIGAVLSSISDNKDDIVVIDDGSTDKTKDIVSDFGINCISHQNNLGLSAAYNSMFNYADKHGYTHLVTLDGDGQHDPIFIPQFIDKLDTFDFVIGNRFNLLDGIPSSKLASNFFAVMLAKTTFGMAIPDVACGFRAMKLDDETKFIHSLHYGVVYESLFKKMNSKSEIGAVNIPATYPSTDLLLTNSNEIFGLMGEIIKYNRMFALKTISYKLFMENDFEIVMESHWFKARYINDGNYLFSTDIKKAKQFYFDNFNSN